MKPCAVLPATLCLMCGAPIGDVQRLSTGENNPSPPRIRAAKYERQVVIELLPAGQINSGVVQHVGTGELSDVQLRYLPADRLDLPSETLPPGQRWPRPRDPRHAVHCNMIKLLQSVTMSHSRLSSKYMKFDC